MRSLWLASVAVCFTAGAAMAQTTSSSPAPTGAPNAAMASPNASPGNMAPANGMTTTKPVYSGQNSVKTVTSSPAPTGAPNAAMASPGASPGNMAPNNGGMANGNGGSMGMTASSGMSAPAPKHMAMSGGHGMALPANADARTYLHIASTAIKHHDKALAEEALSHAETRLLTRAVPASAAATPDDSAAVSAIEHARQALMAGDYSTAQSDTAMAMHAHHGMGMSGPGAMGGPSQ